MRPVSVLKGLATAVSNGICLSQTPGAGASTLTLNGSLVSAVFPNVGVAVMDTQRQVKVDPGAGNFSAATITVNGTDESGVQISESFAGGNAAATASTASFKTVTSITIAGGPGAVAITVGTNGIGATVPIVVDRYIAPANISIAAEVSGTVNYTCQYTYDDVFALAATPALINWFNITALAAQTTTKDAAVTAPVIALRTVINSNTPPGSVTTKVVQAGGHGMA